MSRRGMTILETVVAIACLGIAATLVTQLAAWSLNERARADTRLAAMEWAANILEKARAMPWAELTPEWAAKQTLPADLAERMFNPTTSVVITSEPNVTGLKRVAVNVTWYYGEGAKAPPVEFMTLFADKATGGAP